MLKTIAISASFAVLPGLALADSHIIGDPAVGERAFRKCKACHAVGADAANKAGPVLNGVVDRAVGAAEGFDYSDTLMALNAEGRNWTAENLDEFLTKPREYAPGTKMAFAGVRKEEERLGLIAYLATFE